MGSMQKERKGMYDEVFSDVRWLSDMGANESNAQEVEPEAMVTIAEPDRRLRVLTPRQRARLIEPVSILYLG
jgi:hypothetical protein